MARYVSNYDMRVELLPPPGAPWDEVARFAGTFDGVRHWGSAAAAEEVARERSEESLTALRTWLSVAQRRAAIVGEPPDEGTLARARDVLQLIRARVMGARELLE